MIRMRLDRSDDICRASDVFRSYRVEYSAGILANVKFNFRERVRLRESTDWLDLYYKVY